MMSSVFYITVQELPYRPICYSTSNVNRTMLDSFCRISNMHNTDRSATVAQLNLSLKNVARSFRRMVKCLCPDIQLNLRLIESRSVL